MVVASATTFRADGNISQYFNLNFNWIKFRRYIRCRSKRDFVRAIWTRSRWFAESNGSRNHDNSDAAGSRIQQKCENWDRCKSRIDEGVILCSCASNGIYDTRTVPRSHGVWFHVAGNHQSEPTSFWFLISISHRIWVNRQIAAHAIPMDVHVDSVFRRSSSALIKSIVKFVLDRRENR